MRALAKKQAPSSAPRLAARILESMAYKRSEFKNKVEEHVGGALLEFYKARLAEKNGETKWVAHWWSEVTRLLEQSLVAVLLHSIRGFSDRRKAVRESIEAVRANDAGYRRAAANVVQRDFKLRKVKRGIENRDTEEFWEMVDGAVEVGLG